MSCEICGRGSCTRSFHSLSEQEEFDTKTGRYEPIEKTVERQDEELSTLRRQLEEANKKLVESSEAFSIVKKLHIKALEECVQLRRDIETWNIYAKESEARIAAAHASRDAEVKALQEKLAKYENAEPVAWRHDHGAENGGYEYYENASCPLCEPLFTHPKE